MAGRIVRLLSAFPEDTNALWLSELAQRADLLLTTTHRLAQQLAGHGLLETLPGGSVRPGLGLWELANRISPTLALRQAAIPLMEDIQQVLNQNVNLAVLDGWGVLFVERLSRRGAVVNSAQVAGRMPVTVSSAGLVLMAFQDKALQNRYVEQFEDLANNLTANSLRARLSETAPGLRSSAGGVGSRHMGHRGSVLNRRQRAVAALGVVVPLREMRLQALVPVLQTAARGLARIDGLQPSLPLNGNVVTIVTGGGSHWCRRNHRHRLRGPQ